MGKVSISFLSNTYVIAEHGMKFNPGTLIQQV
jgi:hypothetical protein